MKFKARIEVRLKKDQLDPQADTIKRALVDLSFSVASVSLSKGYEISLEARNRAEAESAARLMCTRLLVNPTLDQYNLEVSEDVNSVSTEPDS